MVPYAEQLSPDEVSYLCELLHAHLGSIVEKKAQMVAGSAEWQRAEVAGSAVARLLGFLRHEIRSRADEFGPYLVGDLDAELRQLLEGDSP
jgi:hypothetical protein